MYAIAFDLTIDVLKKEYGESYENAYSEIKSEMDKVGFEKE